jgi:hypothetical protein
VKDGQVKPLPVIEVSLARVIRDTQCVSEVRDCLFLATMHLLAHTVYSAPNSIGHGNQLLFVSIFFSFVFFGLLFLGLLGTVTGWI